MAGSEIRSDHVAEIRELLTVLKSPLHSSVHGCSKSGDYCWLKILGYLMPVACLESIPHEDYRLCWPERDRWK